MPQGRRKTPFSGKQKKMQMKAKRDRSAHQTDDTDDGDEVADQPMTSGQRIDALNKQPGGQSTRGVNRFALQFQRDSDETVKKKKEEAKETITFLNETRLEINPQDIELVANGVTYGMPIRPTWNNRMSKSQLEAREREYFRHYVEDIEKNCNLSELSYFELNLETWRQVWRVCEMSDIVLIVTDIRHPLFHFNQSLYDYVTGHLQKDAIVVLNKCDLVPAPLVVAWIEFFTRQYPKINVLPFSSFGGMKVKMSGANKGRRLGKMRLAREGSIRLWELCKNIVADNVNLTSWKSKIDNEMVDDESEVGGVGGDDYILDKLEIGERRMEKIDLSYYDYVGNKYNGGILTIGFVGHPNVGKSSLLNGLMGKTVVSVSQTPGHTKHFQTIFLTANVKLCDCPGLVFPSKIPRAMQVLMGCFPIAQLRDPYSAVRYLSERVDVIKLLKLRHPAADDKWSTFDICEAWAIQRGFYTAKAARPDGYRAANHLLRRSLDGRTLCLKFYPPNYVKEVKQWSSHKDVKVIESIQCKRPKGEEEEEEEEEEQPTDEESESIENSEDELVANVCGSNKFALLDVE